MKIVSSNEINIRQANKLDSEKIANVHVASWQATYTDEITNNIFDNLSKKHTIELWSTVLAQNLDVFVVEYENDIIGFASICPCRDENVDPTSVAEISAIYFLPPFWGQGYGQRLCRIIFEYAKMKGFKVISVWVVGSNNQARRFYEKIGFHMTSTHRIEIVKTNSLEEIRYEISL